MSLSADADQARNLGLALEPFVLALPEHNSAIDALIAQLFAISAALRDLEGFIYNPIYGRRATSIIDDVDIVRSSLLMTLGDAHKLLGQLGRYGYSPTPGAYHHVWTDINSHFQRESRIGLRARLECYRAFLIDLTHKLRR